MSEPTSDRVEDRLAKQAEPRSGGDGQPQRVPINMYETDAAVVIVAPLPGVMPDDIQITVDGNQLRLTAEMRSDAPKDYLVREWTYGPYERTVELPDGFGGDATASYGNGQLAVRVTRGRGAGGKVTISPGD